MSEEEEGEEKEGEGEEGEEKEENEEEGEEKEEGEDDGEEGEEKEDGEEKEVEEEEEKKEEKKDSKVINKFLSSKLLQSSEIKIDFKGNSNTSNILGTNINNNSFLTAAFPLRSSLQILTDINQEMDILSSNIKRNILKDFSTPPIYQPESVPYLSSNNYSRFYDKEDLEIKELINQANHITNKNEMRLHKYYNTMSNKEFFDRRSNFTDYRRGQKPRKNFYDENKYYKTNVDSEYNSDDNEDSESIEYFKNKKRNYTYSNINRNRNRIYNDDNDNRYINTNDNHYRNKNYKKRENLYNNTYNPKRRIQLYTQPYINTTNNNFEYINKRIKTDHFSTDNNVVGYNNDFRYMYRDRDNGITNRKNKNLRFNTMGPERDLNVLRGMD